MSLNPHWTSLKDSSISYSPPSTRFRCATCEEQGESERFQSGYRKVAYHCDSCGIEVGNNLQDTEAWRYVGEKF